MTNITIWDDVKVELVDAMGSDASIVQAARVSVVGGNEQKDEEEMSKKDKGLIGYLAREHHGSPFEHNAMTFFVQAPIFVFREFMRHRIASYNEMSGRYTELEGFFYVPEPNRGVVNAGKDSKPELVMGTEHQQSLVQQALIVGYEHAWEQYQHMLDNGIAKEVARLVLPVGIFSQMYVTMNLRSIMNFLSLRTEREDAVHVSHPQREIEMVAEKIEELVRERFPVAMAEFDKNGRVAP